MKWAAQKIILLCRILESSNQDEGTLYEEQMRTKSMAKSIARVKKTISEKKIEVCALCGTLRLTRRVSSGALTSISFAVLFLNNLRDGLYRKEGTARSLMRAQNLNM